MSNNLPTGVTENMIPGNRPEDAEWEKFYEWADDQMDGLYVADAYRAVKIGLAAIQAEQEDINIMLRSAREEERMEISQLKLT